MKADIQRIKQQWKNLAKKSGYSIFLNVYTRDNNLREADNKRSTRWGRFKRKPLYRAAWHPTGRPQALQLMIWHLDFPAQRIASVMSKSDAGKGSRYLFETKYFPWHYITCHTV